MTQDIKHWLTEIRTLQRQLATTRQERDQAYKSAANWRKLYEAEAKQRRESVEQLELTVNTLRTELSTLQVQQDGTVSPEIIAMVAEPDLASLEGLRTQLVKALQQCDRLQKELDAERTDHVETRKTLTTALGEAIDVLHTEQAALVRQSTGSELKLTD